MIPLFKVYMNKDAPKIVGDVLTSGMITQSQKVEEFEARLREWFDYPYILTVNSATSGLTLAYRLLGVCEDNEVLSTPLTCFATTCAILANTKNIRWVDTDPETCNIDLEDAYKKITPRTKALSIVHWGGNPVNLDRVKELKEYAKSKYSTDLGVVEDCAHAFGAEWRGRKLGTHYSNIAVYSLQAIKHLTTGDGGLIFLPNKELYERAKLLRWYGIDREKRSGGDFRLESDIGEWGYKFHMNDINAAIGLANLPDMKDNLEKIRRNAEYYWEELGTCEGIKLFSLPEEESSRDFESDSDSETEIVKPSYWIYTIRVLNGMKSTFIDYMIGKGITVSQVHARNDNNSAVSYAKASLPNLDKLEKEIVAIPCGWWLTRENLSYIVACIKEFCRQQVPVIRKLTYDKLNDYRALFGYYEREIDEPKIDEKTLANIYILCVRNEIYSTAKLFIEDKIGDPVGHIENVFTRSEKRGNGFGRQIVCYLSNEALKRGCYKVVLSAKDELKSFYESCGFHVSGLAFTRRK